MVTLLHFCELQNGALGLETYTGRWTRVIISMSVEPRANGKRQSFMHNMLMEWSDRVLKRIPLIKTSSSSPYSRSGPQPSVIVEIFQILFRETGELHRHASVHEGLYCHRTKTQPVTSTLWVSLHYNNVLFDLLCLIQIFYTL